MNATITDAHTLDAISPVDLASYLRVRGWKRGPDTPGGLAQTWLWHFADCVDQSESGIDVIVPGDRQLRDFRRRIKETLTTLEEIENRSQLEILADIQQISSDVIRWRWIQDDSGDGTIPLEQGQQFFAQVRSQLLAAACSAVHPLQFFASRKPARAIEYLRRARLGQSERGSYVVTVQSPVPPAMPLSGLEDEAEPFERQVTLTLSNALHFLRRVAAEALVGGPVSPDELSRNGVSSNFCDTVTAMLAGGETRRDVEIRFSFAGSRPRLNQAAAVTRFSSDLAPAIGVIGNSLRETATRENFELVGFVTDLARGPQDGQGKGVVQGLVDGVYRRVELELAAEEYETILTPAHRDRNIIRCEGELQKIKGKTYQLLNARSLDILPV